MSGYSEKVIKLQKENKQLRKALETKHYCKYANRCNEVYDCTREEYNSMAECNMELWLKNDELQQENKQLKEQLEYLRSNEYLNQVKWERNFNEELVKDLQQRIDKAINYIKKDYYTIDMGDIVKEDLLKILGDKE